MARLLFDVKLIDGLVPSLVSLHKGGPIQKPGVIGGDTAFPYRCLMCRLSSTNEQSLWNYAADDFRTPYRSDLKQRGIYLS